MEKDRDPLFALVSEDARSIDRQKLAALLAPFIIIDKDSKDFGFTAMFDGLEANDTKIEILLAGTKARALLFDMSDGMLPGEIISTSIMPEGSVKTSLKRLYDNGKIKKDKKTGRYSLPPHRISELAKRVDDKQR